MNSIDIDMDKPCTKCGVMGATQSGICLECATKSIKKRDELRFLKVKLKVELEKIRVHVEWERKNGIGWDELLLTTADRPMQSFHEAMQALRQDVIEMCELPLDYSDRIIVKGVSFSYGGDAEVMGATVTAAMELKYSNVPLNINTPFKAEKPYSEGGADPKQLLDPACVRRLYALAIEAERYVNGDREQMDLFAQGKKAEQMQEAGA